MLTAKYCTCCTPGNPSQPASVLRAAALSLCQPFQISPTVAIRRRAATAGAVHQSPLEAWTTGHTHTRVKRTARGGALGHASLFRHRPWLGFPRRRAAQGSCNAHARPPARRMAIEGCRARRPQSPTPPKPTCRSQRSHDIRGWQWERGNALRPARAQPPGRRQWTSRAGAGQEGHDRAWRASRGRPAAAAPVSACV
jgi:hypothetical protein